MEKIEEINNRLMEMLGDRPFYIFTGLFDDIGFVCLISIKIYNKKNFKGERLEKFLKNKYKKFIKFMEDSSYYNLPWEDINKYTFDKSKTIIKDIPVAQFPQSINDLNICYRTSFIYANERNENEIEDFEYIERMDEMEWQHTLKEF